MSRSYKGGTRGPSANVNAAQQIAAQQMSFTGTGGLGIGGTALTGTRTRPLSATSTLRSTGTLTRPTGPRRPAARGSAAPGGDTVGAFDLSTFTATTPSPHAATSSSLPPAPVDTSPSSLENEYIVNLQQQVYFLELELNLLKKAGAGGGTNPSGLRGSGAPPDGSGVGDIPVPDAPLDDVIVSLREKYVRMEADLKKEVDDLKSQNNDLRSRARMRELELENLKKLHQDLSDETAEWKAAAQDHQATLLDHQLANEQMILKLTARLKKREEKLDRVVGELVDLKAKHQAALEEYDRERDAYTRKWEEREKDMDELNNALLREKEKNLEWAERFRQGTSDGILQGQVAELQERNVALESERKKAILRAEQAERSRQAALESVDKLMDENEQLRQRFSHLETDLREREAKEARDRESKIFWSSEVSSLQMSVASLTDRLAKMQAKYNDVKNQRKGLKDELIHARVALDEIQKRLREESESHAHTRGEEEKSNELNRELRRDLTLKTDELSTLIKKYKELRERADADRKERDALSSELEDLRTKVDLSEALQKLKLHEFVSMAHSNLKVAGAIENLMDKIKQKRKEDKEKERRRAERERGHDRDRDRDRDRRGHDLYYSNASSSSASTSRNTTPRHGHGRDLDSSRTSSSIVTDSRPTTQASEMTDESSAIDSRPVTASSAVETSFDGV